MKIVFAKTVTTSCINASVEKANYTLVLSSCVMHESGKFMKRKATVKMWASLNPLH